MKPAIAKISRCRSRVSGARRKFIRPFIICTLLPIAACEPAVLDPRGPVSLAERAILVDSLGIMLSIVVPTIIATLAFAWWFRASNKRAAYLPSWAYSGKIELVTWSVPLLTITLLGGVAWISSHDLDQRWLAEFGQRYKWKPCLKAAKMPRIRSEHGTTSETNA